MEEKLMEIVGDVNSWYRNAQAPKSKVVSYIVEQIIYGLEGYAVLDEKGNGTSFVWNGVYYEYISIAHWGRILRKIFKDSFIPFVYNIRDRNEFFKTLIEQWEITEQEAEEINTNRAILPFRNGHYFREQHKFVKKGEVDGIFCCNPKIRFNTCVNVEWPDEYEIPIEFLKFLALLVPEPKDQKKVLEYMAYCLSPRVDWQFHMILVGPPGCGKSEFTKFIALLIPDLCIYVPLDTFMDNSKNKFLASIMRGKWVNMGAEVDGRAMSSGGVSFFKRITGEKYFWTDEKNNPHAKKIRNLLKGLYPINNTVKPSTFVDTAFFERLALISCEEYTGPKLYDLAERIFAEEGPMIARMLVELDLPTDNIRVDAQESEDKWMDHLHSAYLFFNKVTMQGETKAEELFENYVDWCHAHHKYAAKYGGFGRLIKSAGANHSQKMVEGVRFYTYDRMSIWKMEEQREMTSDEIVQEQFDWSY